MSIAVVDYVGNIGSILNMLKKIGATEAVATRDPQEISRADKIILPGVGFFARGMARLNELGLIPSLNQAALVDRKPVLGICLGMQLCAQWSEEGDAAGLGWIPAKIRKFGNQELGHGQWALPTPHMSWNEVTVTGNDDVLFRNLNAARFYFVHSFHMCCDNPSDISSQSEYGYPFVASFRHENIFGVQFHPEKSHRFGMELMRNFAEI